MGETFKIEWPERQEWNNSINKSLIYEKGFYEKVSEFQACKKILVAIKSKQQNGKADAVDLASPINSPIRKVLLVIDTGKKSETRDHEKKKTDTKESGQNEDIVNENTSKDKNDALREHEKNREEENDSNSSRNLIPIFLNKGGKQKLTQQYKH